MRRRLAVLLSAVLAASTLAVMASSQPAAADTDVCAGQGTAAVGAPGLYYPGFPNQAAGGLTTFNNSTTSGTPPLTTTTTTNVHGGQNLLPFSFGFGAIIGTCVTKIVPLSATGVVSGWCGQSFGTGVTNNGHRFAWVSAASVLTITGELVGVVNAIPDQLGGQSCTTGALQFIVTGAVVLTHCAVSKTKTDTLVSTETQDLRTVDTDAHTTNTHTTTHGGHHVWAKVCV